MSKLIKNLDSLEESIKKLMLENKNLKQKNSELEHQLNNNSTSVSELATEIELLKKENKTLRTANAMLGSSEYKRETKLKINSLIKEIDECIIQLAD
ncbi:hypothetical protein [Psychroflexus aestuariivivens]|uniref:hypothetical protein n=1 Tax=Psychroflexus aestuariivivens TaxID=1795040 RepID=UPI000FDB61D1|nr:hypothetical protein [Psychroflexus aestuariivivens]